MAKWFEKASVEERDHATGLMEYLNKRGADVSLNSLNVSVISGVVVLYYFALVITYFILLCFRKYIDSKLCSIQLKSANV